ncbi:MAG: two-component system response regulator [Acidobacteria bacterium]|nr:MAG: two-component system response regulator [Acidobacteriota bacterium]
MTKILLVEDNEMNRDMLSRRLERRGFEVVLACDGREGILAARSEIPDLILMDLSLPEIDGWEATRLLKSTPDTAEIPILVLTAHAMMSDRERALHAGCDGFAAKPVEFDRLLSKINNLLNRKVRFYDHDDCQTVAR